MTHFASPPPTPHRPKSKSQTPKKHRLLFPLDKHTIPPLPSHSALDSFNRRSKGTPLFLTRPNPSIIPHHPPRVQSSAIGPSQRPPPIPFTTIASASRPAVHSPPSRVVGQLQKADLALPSRPFCSLSSYTHTPIPTLSLDIPAPERHYTHSRKCLLAGTGTGTGTTTTRIDYQAITTTTTSIHAFSSCRPCCSTSRDYVRYNGRPESGRPVAFGLPRPQSDPTPAQ